MDIFEIFEDMSGCLVIGIILVVVLLLVICVLLALGILGFVSLF